MDWAREIRGTASSANEVTPAAASARIVSGAVSGDRKPTSTVSPPSRSISLCEGRCTLATRSAPQTAAASDAIVAPASSNSESGIRASPPAPASITTS
jgi:hypothetical protein